MKRIEKRWLLVFFCAGFALMICSASQSLAVTKTWDGGLGFWNDNHWNGGGAPPVLDGTDDAVIDNDGDWVFYESGGAVDFEIGTGSSLTINTGGTWENTDPEWTNINGDLTLSGGTFRRNGPGGVLYMGGANAVDGQTTNINISGGGVLEQRGEVWLGNWENTVDNLVVNITIDDGTLDLAPASGNSNHSMFFIIPDNNPTWQASGATQGPTYNINFTGSSGTMVVGADGMVRPQYDDVSSQWFWSPLSYETLWDIGILQANGQSGLTGATMTDFFTVTGTIDAADYMLTRVALLGDFNNDGSHDCLDIDELTGAIAAMSTDLTYDMNGDGSVTLADITDPGTGWLAVGGANNPDDTGGNPFLAGDANLDGTVDGPDFLVWNNNKFTPLDAWCGGDFTADGTVDGADFLIWNTNKFNSSDSVASAVPEPASWALMTFAFLGLRRCRRG